MKKNDYSIFKKHLFSTFTQNGSAEMVGVAECKYYARNCEFCKKYVSLCRVYLNNQP